MKPHARPLFARRLLGWLLEDDPYRNAVLGDLDEEADRIATGDGEVAASRWYRRQAMHTALALLPSIHVRVGDVVIGSLIACTLYLGIVSGATAIAVAVAGRAAGQGTSSREALYLVVIALAALLGGITMGMVKYVPPFAAALFVGIGIVVGAHHVIFSAPSETAFRVVKVMLFNAVAIAGIALGVLGRRSWRQS